MLITLLVAELISDFQLVALIKQEHSVFSAYAKISSSANISSLVFGDHFIHSYDFVIGDGGSFLNLRTYSKHGNACYRRTFSGNLNIVRSTQDYLRVSCAPRLVHLPIKLTLETQFRWLESISFRTFPKSMDFIRT